MAKRLKLRFYRASVKEDLNVTEGEFLETWTTCMMQEKDYGCCCSNISARSLFLVFKYLAEKYLQRLKQQTAEETEVLHTTSNKIGKESFLYTAIYFFDRVTLLINYVFFFPKGVFNTTSSNVSNQSSSNGREVITLRPNKQRTKKSKNPFGSCSVL